MKTLKVPEKLFLPIRKGPNFANEGSYSANPEGYNFANPEGSHFLPFQKGPVLPIRRGPIFFQNLSRQKKNKK